MCRTRVPRYFKIKVDKIHQKMLKRADQEEFVQAENELKLKGTLTEKVDIEFEIIRKIMHTKDKTIATVSLRLKDPSIRHLLH